jgi:hypothetical protein
LTPRISESFVIFTPLISKEYEQVCTSPRVAISFDYSFASLTHLDLCRVSTEAIVSVAKLTYLKILKLEKLNDDWHQKDIQELANLPMLRELEILGTDLSAGAVNALSRRNWKLAISVKQDTAEFILSRIGGTLSSLPKIDMLIRLRVDLATPLPILPMIPRVCTQLRELKLNGSGVVLEHVKGFMPMGRFCSGMREMSCFLVNGVRIPLILSQDRIKKQID